MPVSCVAAHTHTGLPREGVRPPPDAQVMARGEGVVLLLEDQVGRLAVQQQRGDGRFLVAAQLRDGAEGFHLGLRAERRRGAPPRLREGLLQLLLARRCTSGW